MERFGQQTYPSVAERNRCVRLVKIGQKLWSLGSGCIINVMIKAQSVVKADNYQ